VPKTKTSIFFGIIVFYIKWKPVFGFIGKISSVSCPTFVNVSASIECVGEEAAKM
jgi:hypothetical protein